MKLFLFCCLLLFTLHTTAQFSPELRLKKRGKVVTTYVTGDPVTVYIQDIPYTGYITKIKNDSVYVNNMGFVLNDFTHIGKANVSQKQHISTQLFLLTTLGVALSTTGMYVAKWETFPRALAYSATVGYLPFVILEISNLFKGNNKIKLGGKYQLQVLDLKVY